MNMLWKAFSPFVVFYFIPLMFLGAFFFINFTLAVIKMKFTKIMENRLSMTSMSSD